MAAPQTPDFAELLGRLATAFASHGVRFMVIGGQAVLLHGEPRLTADVDVTVDAVPQQADKVLRAAADAELVPLPRDPAAFARETFVLPLATQDHLRVDVIFANTAYEREAIGRALRIAIAGREVPFATAEDLVLQKLFSGRTRDIDDVRGVIGRQSGRLDWAYIRRWATSFSEVEGRESLPRQVADLERDFKDFLASMPDVGQDDDFQNSRDMPRDRSGTD